MEGVKIKMETNKYIIRGWTSPEQTEWSVYSLDCYDYKNYKKLINKSSRSHPIKTHLDPVGKLLAVLPNKGSLHCVLQVPEQRFCPCNDHFLLFLLADVLSDYHYHHLDYSYSQISLPIVIPSAALFLLRLGLVRTRTPPLDTLSHWKWDLSKGHDWLFLKFTSVCIASTLFERNKSVLARSLPE